MYCPQFIYFPSLLQSIQTIVFFTLSSLLPFKSKEIEEIEKKRKKGREGRERNQEDGRKDGTTKIGGRRGSKKKKKGEKEHQQQPTTTCWVTREICLVLDRRERESERMKIEREAEEKERRRKTKGEREESIEKERAGCGELIEPFLLNMLNIAFTCFRIQHHNYFVMVIHSRQK